MIMRIIASIFIVGAVIAVPTPENKPISQQNAQTTVSSPLGVLQGSILATRLGKPIFAFRGIRFAKAPIDQLRFQPPIPIEKWEGVYNATIDGPACPQPSTTHTSEDCLLLNVYSTKLITNMKERKRKCIKCKPLTVSKKGNLKKKSTLPKHGEVENRPVIVYFHSGSFYSGSANSGNLSPKYLLDHDIVLVVPNYRLGSLGFLSTGEKENPGNVGFKDQVQALKWVKENIASFGGDPESVTIAGSDAGAISVTLHIVSPLSKGLFHKAIAMSGSTFGTWSIQQNQLELAKRQARLLKCPDDSATSIVTCLKTKSADDIAQNVPKFKDFGSLDPTLVWLPVIEQDHGQERFLVEHPIESVLNKRINQVPFLTGVTTDELAKHAFAVVNSQKLLLDFDKNFETIGPISLLYEKKSDNSKLISKEIKKFYFEDKPVDNSSIAKLTQLYSDAIVGFGVHRAAKLLAENTNASVYYYRFNYKGQHSNFYLPDSNNTVPYGVAHLDDLIYIIPSPNLFADFKQEDPETDLIEKMTKLWSNFANTGEPISEQSDELDNVKWEPFTIKTEKYLDIGNKLMIHEKLFEKRYAEWEKLFPLTKYQEKKKFQG